MKVKVTERDVIKTLKEKTKVKMCLCHQRVSIILVFMEEIKKKPTLYINYINISKAKQRKHKNKIC